MGLQDGRVRVLSSSKVFKKSCESHHHQMKKRTRREVTKRGVERRGEKGVREVV